MRNFSHRELRPLLNLQLPCFGTLVLNVSFLFLTVRAEVTTPDESICSHLTAFFPSKLRSERCWEITADCDPPPPPPLPPSPSPSPPVTVRVEVRLVHSATLSSPADDSRLRHRSSEVRLACLTCQLTGIRNTERGMPGSARTKGKKPINTSFWTLAPPPPSLLP